MFPVLFKEIFTRKSSLQIEKESDRGRERGWEKKLRTVGSLSR